MDSFLGEGTFGKVAKCLKTATNEWVAVKIIKDRPVLIAQAEQEVRQKAFISPYNIVKVTYSIDAGKPRETHAVCFASLMVSFDVTSLRPYSPARHVGASPDARPGARRHREVEWLLPGQTPHLPGV